MDDGLFVVLEPGNHMFMVIEAARRRGLTVVVCHSVPVAPPAPYDRALPGIAQLLAIASWRDVDAVAAQIIAWCGDRPVRGTYAGYEITLRTEARLRRYYGLPGCAPDQLDRLLDKTRVRRALRDGSLSRLRWVDEPALRRLSGWPFPGRAGFLKPVNGQGSIYVRRCSSLADVRDHLAEWDAGARHMRAFSSDHLHSGLGMFLEEEAVGELLSVEGFCYRGRYVPLGITDRSVLARDVAIEMGTTFPCPHPRRDAIIERARAIHAFLGIEHGPTHTEMIVPPDGSDIELVELNLRFAGGDILLQVDLALELPIEDDLLALALGEAPQTAALPAPRRYVTGQDVLAPAHVGTFTAIEIPGHDVAVRKVIARPGTQLKSTEFQTDYVASFVVAGDSYPGVLARAAAVRAAITINGSRLGDDPNNTVINCADQWAFTR
jgi:biotin carboxylase